MSAKPWISLIGSQPAFFFQSSQNGAAGLRREVVLPHLADNVPVEREAAVCRGRWRWSWRDHRVDMSRGELGIAAGWWRRNTCRWAALLGGSVRSETTTTAMPSPGS